MAGAGAILALGPGTAQAAPVVGPSVTPPTTQCLLMPVGCSSSAQLGPSLYSPTLIGYSATPNALAAVSPLFAVPIVDGPLYGLIGIAGMVPIVNIFVSNGVNGARVPAPTAATPGYSIGYGGTGGSGGLARLAVTAAKAACSSAMAARRTADRRAGGNGGNAGFLALFGGHGGTAGGRQRRQRRYLRAVRPRRQRRLGGAGTPGTHGTTGAATAVNERRGIRQRRARPAGPE